MNQVIQRKSAATAKKPAGRSLPRLTQAEKGERSRAAILEAALNFFAERGFYGTSLDEITAAAGTKRSLILYHFKNKMELWRATAQAAALAFDAALADNLSRLPVEDTPEPLRNSVTAWLDAFLEQPRFAQMMVLEGGRPGERLDWLIQNFTHSAIPFANSALRAQMSDTVLRDALMAIFLSMSALGPLMEASLAKITGRAYCGVFPLAPDRRDELIELIVRIVQIFEAKAIAEAGS